MAAKSVALGFLVLMSAGVFYTLQTTCPPGWLAGSGLCYILLPYKMDWEKGRKACESRRSKMVLPNSQEEHDFIWREMKARMTEHGATYENELEVWIGCQEKNGVLSCPGEEGFQGFTNWAVGEPNMAMPDCVRMAEKYGGKWGDIGCSEEKIFAACEMRPTPRLSYCLQADSSGRFTSRCLLNHVIKNLTTTGISVCGQACWAEPRCHSFNIFDQLAKMAACQLNNASSLEADLTDFKKVDDCLYFDL